MARRYYSRQELEEVKRDEWALRSELEPAKHPGFGAKAKYVCPICHKDGKCRVYFGDTAVWSCIRCGESGNIVDLYVKRDGMSSGDACQAVCDRYAQDKRATAPRPIVRQYQPHEASDRTPTATAECQNDNVVHKSEEMSQDNGWRRQCHNYCKACIARLWNGSRQSQKALDYLHERGFDDALIRRCRFGFDDKAMKAEQTPGGYLKFGRRAIIVPYGAAMDYYIARLLPSKNPWLDADGKEIRMLNPKDKAEPIYNQAALWFGFDAVFITEGALDAAAIVQAAATINVARVTAVAINGAANREPITNLLRDNRAKGRLIITLDSDKAGIDGMMGLSHNFNQIQQPHEAIDTSKIWPALDDNGHGCKDAGDILKYYDTDRLAVAIEAILDGTYLEW